MFNWFRSDPMTYRGSRLINHILRRIENNDFDIDPYEKNLLTHTTPNFTKIEMWITNIRLMNKGDKNTKNVFQKVKRPERISTSIGDFFTTSNGLMYENYLEPLYQLLLEALDITMWWEGTKDRHTTTGMHFVNNKKLDTYIISMDRWLLSLLELVETKEKK